MLRKRVITGLWGIPLLIAAVWFDQPLPWFTVLVAIWGVLAAFEFYKLVGGAKIPPLTYFGMLWTLLFIISPHFNYDFITPLLLTSGVVLSLIWLLGRPKKEGAFLGWAWTLAGILYIGWLLSHFVALRGLEDGRNWVFFALFVTFASDTAAFFVGRALGRHKLAPRISPGKTWEGTIAGVLTAIIASLLFTLLIPIGYWKIVVERPLRLRSQFSRKAVEGLRFASGDEMLRKKFYSEFGMSLYEDIDKIKTEVQAFLNRSDSDNDDSEGEAPTGKKTAIPEKKLKKLLNAATWKRDHALYEMGKQLWSTMGENLWEDHNECTSVGYGLCLCHSFWRVCVQFVLCVRNLPASTVSAARAAKGC